MELLILTTPQSVANYQVDELLLNWRSAFIIVMVRDPLGNVIRCDYSGAPATALIVALNKANLTSNSLHKRILNQLTSDGKLPAGTVTGSPD